MTRARGRRMKYCNQLATEIEDYRAYVGGSMYETDMVWAHVAARMAAVLDRLHTGRELPPIWHYGLILTFVPMTAMTLERRDKRRDSKRNGGVL